MIAVNLLPHREARRRRLRRGFYAGLAASAAVGAVAVAAAWSLLSQQVAGQVARNAYLEAGIARLDVQIRDIAGLRAEMAELEARGRIVQGLQSRRNASVKVLTALAEQAPAGLKLSSVKQTGLVVAVSGLALSSEHVAVLMRDVTASASPFERAEIVEVRALPAGAAAAPAPTAPGGPEAERRLFEFSLRLTLRSAEDLPPAAAAPSAPGR